NRFYVAGPLKHAPVLQFALESTAHGPEKHQPGQPAPDQPLGDQPDQPAHFLLFKAKGQQRYRQVHQHEDKIISANLGSIAGEQTDDHEEIGQRDDERYDILKDQNIWQRDPAQPAVFPVDQSVPVLPERLHDPVAPAEALFEELFERFWRFGHRYGAVVVL